MKDGDYIQALRFLRLGMTFAPEGQQLLYLSRVLDRMVPPELIQEQKKETPTRIEAEETIMRVISASG